VYTLKVLDVSHVNSGIDDAIVDIDSFHEQISAIQRAVRDFHALDDALKGKGGEAIRTFFNEVHQPFLIYLYQSMVDYKNTLTKMKDATESFESHPSGFVSQEFLEQDVTDGFDKVKNVTTELTDEANSILERVQDLVSVKKIDPSEVMDTVQDGKKKAESIVEALSTLDDHETSQLEKTKEDLQMMRNYISEIAFKFKSGDLSVANYDIEAVKNIDAYKAITDEVYGEGYADSVALEPLFEKMLNGQDLTPDERELLYKYLQNEVINDEVRGEMQAVIDMIGDDSDKLINRLNHDVLATEDALDKEKAMIEAYLYSGNEGQRDNETTKEELDKLRTYLSVLNNYKTAIGEVKEEMEWERTAGSSTPLLARVEKLDYIENKDPFTMTFETDITIMLNQYTGFEREEFLNIENPLVIRSNESEVTYFRGDLSGVQLQNSMNENLEEEIASHTSNFIGAEALKLLISGLGRAAPVVSSLGTLGDLASDKHKMEQRLNIGEAKSTINALEMNIQISDRFVPGSGQNEYIIQMYPTKMTFALFNRWEEVYNINPDIPYPEQAIQNQDWETIADCLSGNDYLFQDINPDLSRYINHNEIDDDKTVEMIAR